MIINSTQIENKPLVKRGNLVKSNVISLKYELDGLNNGGTLTINDERIITEEIADIIARAEFLENGYINQVVEFTTDFNDLKINDIISIYAPTYRIPRELNKDRFIVKRIEHIFQDGFIKSRIKAVRYDL